MFGRNNSHSSSSSSSSSVIKSGYNPLEPMSGMGTMKSEFVEALTISTDDCNPEAIQSVAKRSGEYRGYNELFKRASTQKLKLAQSINQLYGAVWQHANSAAQAELGWERTTARGLERMSTTMLDLGVEQKSHEGFATYLNTADKLITY